MFRPNALVYFAATIFIYLFANLSVAAETPNYSTITETPHHLTVPAGPFSVVDTATGRLITSIPIVSWAARGKTSVNFALSHVTGDSVAGDELYDGRPAAGWKHSYNNRFRNTARIPECSSPTSCYWWLYKERWPGNPNDLSNPATDIYEVTTKERIVYRYSQHAPLGSYFYYLSRVSDTRGNQINLKYGNSTYKSMVTEVSDSSGRKLVLTWETNSNICRLKSVSDPKGRIWDFKYENTGEWWELSKIEYPAVNGVRPYVRFTYEQATGWSYKIKTISIPKNNGETGELTWTYTYATGGGMLDSETQWKVARIDAPTAGNAKATKTTIDYDDQTIDGVFHFRTTIKDALYVDSYPRRHRVIHLYRCDWWDTGNAKFGPVIHYIVGSESTNDSNATSASAHLGYPGCPLTKYEWNIVDDATIDGTLKTYTDPNEKTWSFKYSADSTKTDNRLNLWEVTDPLGNITTMTYNSWDTRTKTGNYLIESTTDPCSHKTYYQYNKYNELSEIHTDKDVLNLTELYTYDDYGNIQSKTDSYGKKTSFEYDSIYHCFLTKQTEGATGIVTEIGGYDALGNKGWSKAPRRPVDPNIPGDTGGPELTTNYVYEDGLGQLKTITNPDTSTILYTYDTNGNKMTETDPNGNTVSYKYDNFGHVKSQTSKARKGGNGADTYVTVSYCYDELGRHQWTKWTVNGSEKAIYSYYDERNRLIKETLPGNRPAWYQYNYDVAGNMTSKLTGHKESTSDKTDQTLLFTYDDLGRALEDKCGAIVLAKRTYTPDGLLQSISSAGAFLAYTYDGAHREKLCYQAHVNKTVEHTYQTPPNKTLTVNIRNGGVTSDKSGTLILGAILGTFTHEYDDDWRPISLSNPMGIKTTYGYDGGTGLLSKVIYNANAEPKANPGCPYTTLNYDTDVHKRLWLTSVGNFRSDGSVISSFSYEYDKAGNRTKMTEEKEVNETNGDYTSYGYDSSYNLLNEERKTGANTQVYKYDYWYDEAGNRTKKILTNSTGTKTYTYGYDSKENNLLTGVSVNGTSTGTFTYDSFGNQSTRIITGQPTWYYTYDTANHLTKIGTSSGGYQVGMFKYDPLGRRIERADKGRRFIYYGNSLIAETNSENNIVAWYTPGICEGRIEGTGKSAAWKTYYYHCDGQGTTREMTDSMQRLTDAYAYNAWGEDLGQLRPSTDTAKPVNPLRYVGKEGYYSDDTGLMLLGARYYDPLIGRFITQDPSRDGMNWYAYAGNNPVNMIDPTGLIQEGEDKGYIWTTVHWKIPSDYGKVPSVMVAYRPITTPGVDQWWEHAFLVIDGIPIGYGQRGVGQIDTDVLYLSTGKARLDTINVNSSQLEKLRNIRDDYLSGPTISTLNNKSEAPKLPDGPWLGKGDPGGFIWNKHNCGMWVNAALEAAGITAKTYRVPDLVNAGLYKMRDAMHE